jgi:hypothetical protein
VDEQVLVHRWIGGGSGAELINHCCEPNCVFERKRGRAWVRSLRAIAAGEELLLDYHFPKDSVPTPCYCGVVTCRGTINMKGKNVSAFVERNYSNQDSVALLEAR